MNITPHADYVRVCKNLTRYFRLAPEMLPSYIRKNYGGNYEAFLQEFEQYRYVGRHQIDLLRTYLKDKLYNQQEPNGDCLCQEGFFEDANWELRQYEIAKDVFCALIRNYDDYEPSGDAIVRMAKNACEYADMLVDGLRGDLK